MVVTNHLFCSESSLQVYSPAANFCPTRTSLPPPPWDWYNASPEVSPPHVLACTVSRLSNLDTKGGIRDV